MKDHGCNWTGQLRYLDTHFTKECLIDRVKCDQCTENVPKYNLNTHLANDCPEREFSCKYCNFKATYKIVSEQHFNICTYYILNCPNGCGAHFERGDLEDHTKMCSLQKVQCEFSYAGCETEFIRDRQKDHMEQNTQKHLALIAAALRYQQQTFLNLRNEDTQERDEQHIRDDQNAQRQHAPGIKIQRKYEECKNRVRKRSKQVEQIHEQEEQIHVQHQLQADVVVNPQELRNRPYSISKVLTLIAPILVVILLGFHFQSLLNTDTNTLEGREEIGQKDKLNTFGLEIVELKKLVEQLKPLQKAPEQEGRISRLEDQITELQQSIKDSIDELTQTFNEHSNTQDTLGDIVQEKNEESEKRISDMDSLVQSNDRKIQELFVIAGGMDGLKDRISILQKKIIELVDKILLLEQGLGELKQKVNDIPNHPPHHHHKHHGGRGGCHGHH